jgi:hypothetical protein
MSFHTAWTLSRHPRRGDKKEALAETNCCEPNRSEILPPLSAKNWGMSPSGLGLHPKVMGQPLPTDTNNGFSRGLVPPAILASTPNSQLEWPAASTQVDGNLTILAEVRLSAGESRLDELERGYGLARRPIP